VPIVRAFFENRVNLSASALGYQPDGVDCALAARIN
jgi:hypothetical protein